MNRRQWLLCLASGSLLKTAEGAGITKAPVFDAATPETSFDAVTLVFKLQSRWVNDDITDPDFSNPYWGSAHREYRWAAVHPHNGDIIVADAETQAKWDAELRHLGCAETFDADGWTKPKPLEDLGRVKWCERTVVISPEAWKQSA